MSLRDKLGGAGSGSVRAARWAALIAAGALISGFVGAVAEREGWFDFSHGASIPSQLDAIRGRAARSGLGVVVSKRADLHGNGGASYVLVFRSLKLLSRTGYGPAADEVRIYDVGTHNRLELKFQFRPRVTRSDPTWLFRLDSVSDLDENGRPEIVGAWEQLGMEPLWPRPVIISWNDGTKDYDIEALLNAGEVGLYHSNRPILRSPRPRNGFAAGIRDVYVKPTKLRNVYGGRLVLAYGTEDFAVERVGFGAVLAAIFITRGSAHADSRADQVLLWNVGLQLAKPQLLLCVDPHRPLIVNAQYPLSEWLRTFLRRSRSRVRFCQ